MIKPYIIQWKPRAPLDVLWRNWSTEATLDAAEAHCERLRYMCPDRIFRIDWIAPNYD
jgi:hypothetical protein